MRAFVCYCRYENMIPKVIRLGLGYVLCLLSRQSALTNKLQYIRDEYHVFSHKVQLQEEGLFFLVITKRTTKFFVILAAPLTKSVGLLRFLI